MSATVAGCSVGFSEDMQRYVPEPCAKCKNPNTDWHPWPGLWLCRSCFINTDSREFAALVKRLEVVKK